MVESSAKVKPWRQDVRARAIEAIEATDWQAPAGPVFVTLTFYLQRPKGHYGSGRNAGTLRPTAPESPAVKPDLDKLIRSTMDALTEAGVVRDDAQVVELAARKRYAVGPVGAFVEVQVA
jgi:Holliday junction resolvase RusA-like endonuclease